MSKNLAPEVVQSNYTHKESQEIRYDFTHSELLEMKDTLTDLAIQKSKKEQLLKAVTVHLKVGIENILGKIQEIVEAAETNIDDRNLTELTKRHKSLLTKIANGYEMRETIVYTLEDSEAGKLEFYDGNGVYLGERKLAGRHQMSLLSKVKTSTNE